MLQRVSVMIRRRGFIIDGFRGRLKIRFVSRMTITVSSANKGRTGYKTDIKLSMRLTVDDITNEKVVAHGLLLAKIESCTGAPA